jgi:CRISPR-associated protein (TIGR03986 family)
MPNHYNQRQDHRNSGRKPYRQNNREQFNRNIEQQHNQRHEPAPNSPYQILNPPYNFVPLNENPVEDTCYPGKKIDQEKALKLNIYLPDLKTGYIDIKLTTLTPLYIRDTLTDTELKEKTEKEKNKGRYINPDFFSPGNKVRIPGSSLRGMIRTLVEIITFGKFTQFDGDRKFFYRALGDKSLDLRDKYKNLFTENIIYDHKNCYRMKCYAGFLTKINGEYRIKPSDSIKVNGENVYVFRIENDLINLNIPETHLDDNYFFQKVYFRYDPGPVHKHRGGQIKLFYLIVTKISDTEIDGYRKGYLIITGPVPHKHMQHIILPPDNRAPALDIVPEFIEAYKKDKYRKAVNLIDLLDALSTNQQNAMLPCFYLKGKDPSGNEKVIAFGHTPYFRFPYQYKIRDLVPPALLKDNLVDIPEAIFGNEKSFASRVFFEDAFPLGNVDFEPICIPKILAEPKPTCFQFYLKQDRYRTDNFRGYWGLKDYDQKWPDNLIRGYKLYWHHKEENPNFKDSIEIEVNKIDINEKAFLNGQNTNIINKKNKNYFLITNELLRRLYNNYKANANENEIEKFKKLIEIIAKYDTQHTVITPISARNEFKARIRFENLTDVELGALLFVLSLPKNCAHKLGMGKPLGLGSVTIQVENLFISNRVTRYSSLESEWLDSITTDKIVIENYVKIFEKFIKDKLNWNKYCNQASLWDHPRLKELKALLSFDPVPISNYPSLDEYQQRHPLKKASDLNII